MGKNIKFPKLGKTKNIIKTLQSLGINENDFHDSGCTATVFIKNNQAIKVCRKTIRYFKSYEGNAQSFKIHVNSLNHIFLPVKDILYEDSQYFIYTQDLCVPLDKKLINKKIAAEFLQLFKSLVKKDSMVSGLSPGNLCIHEGHLLIYDYHGLHKLTTFQNSRVPRNLTKYMTLAFCPTKYSDHKVIMREFNKKSIKKLSQLPSTFIDLLKIMLEDKHSPQKVISQIDICLSDSF